MKHPYDLCVVRSRLRSDVVRCIVGFATHLITPRKILPSLNIGVPVIIPPPI